MWQTRVRGILECNSFGKNISSKNKVGIQGWSGDVGGGGVLHPGLGCRGGVAVASMRVSPPPNIAFLRMLLQAVSRVSIAHNSCKPSHSGYNCTHTHHTLRHTEFKAMLYKATMNIKRRGDCELLEESGCTFFVPFWKTLCNYYDTHHFYVTCQAYSYKL